MLPSEISNLKTFESYINIADHGVTKSRLEYKHYPGINASFILRDDLSMTSIDKANKDYERMLDRFYMSSEEKRRMGDKWNDHDSGLYESSDVL